jgi:hypothetical protein
LANVANDEVDPNGRVDADDKVAHVPEDDGEVKVAPDELMGEELVHDVKGNGENEAKEVGGGDPLVALAEGEHFGGHGPGDAVGVDGLDP